MTATEILALTDADRAHRREFMEYCVTAAEDHFQRLLRVLYEHFEQWNEDFFGGQLFPPHFLILAPKSPSAEGDYAPYSGWGSKSQLRLRPSLFDATHPHLVNGSRDPEGLQRYWLDVALHEVVHQYCNEILGKPERAEKGHGSTFVKECTRIGALMGLPAVGPARKSRNKDGLPSCAFWPTCVRPADYYLGAYRPDLAPKRGKGAAGAPAGAPITEDTGDEEGIDSPDQPERGEPLQPAEWRRLFAAVRELAIAELVERLAEHHGVPVIYPAMSPARVETPATVAEMLAIAEPPLPATLVPQGDASTDAEILARLPAGFKPSQYQMGLFRFVLFGQGDGLVSAVAGSGKTTSLTLAAKLTEGDGLFLAFNKHIAEELGERLKGTRMIARTIHGIGYATLMRRIGKGRIDEQKYRKLAQDAIRGTRIAFGEPQRKAIDALRELVNLSRLTLTDPQDRSALEVMIYHFGIEIDPEARADVLALLPRVLAEGERIAEAQKVIDYTDQLYLCYRWQLQPKQFPWVLVDECQDLGAAQLDLVLKSRAPGGRILFVGDSRQAIMGFAGADADSFWNIQRRTGATLLPLSVCYRCPTSHLDMARSIVPEIEAAPGATAGEIDTIEEEQIGDRVQPGDMIICRLTAPLIKICIQLIQRRLSARVRGRDIGEQLSAIVKGVTEHPAYRWADFGHWLNTYADFRISKLAQREGSEGQVESLRDRVEAVRVCYESFDVQSAEDLIKEIERLFNDDQPDIVLSTVHKAKGLENDRIFVLYPEKLPLVWEKQQDWQLTQEMNLRYVALTRAKRAMIFVREKPKKKR
jgi:ATP-dependent DNA helicase UvrD/PcrA